MSKSASDQLGFTVWIDPRPGTTFAEQGALARRLEDYGRARDLFFGGAPLCAAAIPAKRISAGQASPDIALSLTLYKWKRHQAA